MITASVTASYRLTASHMEKAAFLSCHQDTERQKARPLSWLKSKKPFELRPVSFKGHGDHASVGPMRTGALQHSSCAAKRKHKNRSTVQTFKGQSSRPPYRIVSTIPHTEAVRFDRPSSVKVAPRHFRRTARRAPGFVELWITWKLTSEICPVPEIQELADEEWSVGHNESSGASRLAGPDRASVLSCLQVRALPRVRAKVFHVIFLQMRVYFLVELLKC